MFRLQPQNPNTHYFYMPKEERKEYPNIPLILWNSRTAILELLLLFDYLVSHQYQEELSSHIKKESDIRLFYQEFVKEKGYIPPDKFIKGLSSGSYDIDDIASGEFINSVADELDEG